MINIKDLSFSYTKNKPYLLNNVFLNIQKGSYVSIVGENGSCKSTLMKLILGLLSPIKGEICINSNNIGYVPQRLDSFNSEFPITVLEILNSHSKIKSNINNTITNALNSVNMGDFKNSLLGNLSGGQQQRILIARALLTSPDIIFLDEPSTGIDNATQNDIYNILSDLNKKNGVTILSIEHNLEIALKYSTHILELNDGKALYYTVDDFKSKKNINIDFNKAI